MLRASCATRLRNSETEGSDAVSAISYDSIVHNIDQVSVDGNVVNVSWKCPASGRIIGSSTATMAPDQSISTRVGASVKRSIASEIIYGAARIVSGLIGGAAGRVVSNAVYTAANDINTRAVASVDYSEASRRDAIVLAFEGVKSSFEWNDKRRQFVAASAAPPAANV
jgi:hypothetical protein